MAKTKFADDAQQWVTYSGSVGKSRIVLVSGDEEYRSEEALPQLAKILSVRHGFNCTVLFAQDPKKPGILNPNYLYHIPGLEKLQASDLIVIFVRFRALPDAQMRYIDQYLTTGRPVIGIRTATHAFNFNEVPFESKYKHYGNFYSEDTVWKGGFGRLILGEKWISHHGRHRHQSTRGIAALGAEGHPILNGIEDGDIWGPTDVYGIRLPLCGDSQPLVLGQVINPASKYDEEDVCYGMRSTDNEIAHKAMKGGKDMWYDPNNPMMPISWVKSYQLPNGKKGKAFATTIGAANDLLSEGTRRMMVNAVFWCLGLEVPNKANVDAVGTYAPNKYEFHEEDYWIEQNRSVSSLR